VQSLPSDDWDYLENKKEDYQNCFVLYSKSNQIYLPSLFSVIGLILCVLYVLHWGQFVLFFH